MIAVLPLFAIMAAMPGISFCRYFYLYMSTTELLKEVAGTSSATVVANANEALQGMDVIHAYRQNIASGSQVTHRWQTQAQWTSTWRCLGCGPVPAWISLPVSCS